MPPKFGSGGDKCGVCDRTVYATEKLVLEGKDSRVTLHKLCFRCKHCNKALEVGKYTAADGQYYCEPHYKQLVVSAGSLDDVSAKSTKAGGKSPAVVTSTPTSFVPVESSSSDASSSIAANKQETPAHIAAKFKGGDSEKCLVCGARVYATERLPVDTASGQVVLHKACLKCATCSTKLEIGQSTMIEGKFYCKRHAKDQTSVAHSNAPGAILGGDDAKDKDASESGAEDGGAGGKFGGANERCAVCTKRVYATERVPIDTATGQIVLHKPCLKCADCSTKLEVGAFTLIESKFYCKRHAKDHASVSHGNTPGAIPDESGASSAKEGESGAEDAGGKFGGAVERCAVCSKRVYATERMPIDGTNGQDILHKSCLKCADCQSVLKMDTFTRIDGAFYCKRHAKDHTSVSHNNAPGAIPDEKAGGDAAASDSERCLVCKKKVFATERMPIDGVGDASVIHRTCLKCADCSTTLKVDTYTRIGDAFYCKRHAQDHAGEYAPTAASAAAKSGDAPAASKSIKVDRDICPVCSKAVYATEKLIVSDAFDSKTLHKTCFRCKTCDTKLDMRTYVSAGDGQYFCKPHKPEILRAKGAGDMYAAYGSEYGADANGGSKPQSTAARLEAEGHAFQQEKKPEKDDDDDDDKNNTTNNANNDNNKNNDDDDNKKAKAAAESDNEEVAGGAEESEEKEKEKEPEPVKEEPKKEAAAAAPAAAADDDREARRAAREKARKEEEAAAASSADADREARRAAREKARKEEEEAAAAADAERERKRAERRAAADAEAKKAEEEAERAAAERKAKREAREKEAAEEAAKAEKELADRRAKREAEREKASETTAAAADDEGGDDGANDAADAGGKKGSKVRVRRRKDKS